MTTVTQRDMHIRWAADYMQVSVWSTYQQQHIVLEGYSDTPQLKICSDVIEDAKEWIADNELTIVGDIAPIDIWEKEWAKYKEVVSQVNLPVTATACWGRKLTYTLPVHALDEYSMNMFVNVEVGYSDNGGPYCGASLYLNLTDDEDDEVVAKTLLSHYTLQLPIDIKTVREAIQPGIRYLADTILDLSL